MIITVQGTHGSGKSTIVREIMSRFPTVTPITLEGRKRPIGYICSGPETHGGVFIPGHYETPCGGCDNIPKAQMAYDLIREQHSHGYDVLFEGILAQHSTPNIIALHNDKLDVVVIQLDVPTEIAVDGVQARRDKRGDDRPLDPKNIIKEQRSVTMAGRRMRDSGLRVERLDRGPALVLISELLGL